MNLVEMTDEQILEIANPIWDGLIESSNKKRLWWVHKTFF